MKKNICKIGLVLIMLLISTFILTGCGNKSTKENDINEYLSKKYPNETFEIISEQKISKIPIRGNSKGNTEGYKYTVKSSSKNITFTVENIKEISSYGTSQIVLDDNYKREIIKDYIKSFGDERIEIIDKKLENNEEFFITASTKIIVHSNQFTSIKEIATVINNFNNYCIQQKLFDENEFLEILVYHQNDKDITIMEMTTDKSNNIEIIEKELSQLK